jgi:hypothetical protein
MEIAEFISTLEQFLETDAQRLWVVDERVHFDDGFDAFEAAFEDNEADFLATLVRRHAEDPNWNWWKSLVAPDGEDPLIHGLAALLPLVRLSRPAAEVIIRGVSEQWTGHPEAVIPTLVNRAGLQIGDFGGKGSFMPPGHENRWYSDRTWHWQGPVSFVPGKIHFPVSPKDPYWSCTLLADEPTVGFLFLTRGDVNQPAVWREYLASAGNRARVYAHSKHPETLPPDSILIDRQISTRVPTAWGCISLVEATLAMIREALQDSQITHFVLVSESCVPVQPFSALSRSLRLDARSRMYMMSQDSVRRNGNIDKARRFNALREITSEHYWFQDQWMCLNREDAVITSDRNWLPHFQHVWAPDECYFSTVLSAVGKPPGLGILNRALTWTKWHGGSHPRTFDQVLPRLAAEIGDSGCFFARKFGPASDIGRWDLHLEAKPASARFRFELQSH